MAEVQVDDRELVAAVEAFRERAQKTAPIMAIVAEGLVARVNEEFDTEGHGAWPALAESTKRRRRGTTYQILNDTGRAAGSIFALHSSESAEAATDVAYMVFHVSDRPRTRIPLRNPFDIPEDAFDEARDTILEYVTE